MSKPFAFFLTPLLCAALASGSAMGKSTDTDGMQQAPPPAIATQEDVNSSYTGVWLWAEGSDRFTLKLSQGGGKISGFHSMSRDNGGKLDGVATGPLPSISGEVHGTSTVVRFRSGAPGSEGWGHARLTLRGRYLYWELIDSTGDSLLPANAVLIRQDTPNGSAAF